MIHFFLKFKWINKMKKNPGNDVFFFTTTVVKLQTKIVIKIISGTPQLFDNILTENNKNAKDTELRSGLVPTYHKTCTICAAERRTVRSRQRVGAAVSPCKRQIQSGIYFTSSVLYKLKILQTFILFLHIIEIFARNFEVLSCGS